MPIVRIFIIQPIRLAATLAVPGQAREKWPEHEKNIRKRLLFEKNSRSVTWFMMCWPKPGSPLLDWPAHSMDTFIRVVQNNNGVLSSNKRKSHFSWMREDEIVRAEQAVRAAFALEGCRKIQSDAM